MQCLVLDGVGHPDDVQETMARSLLERGSPIDEPLIAAASVGNVVLGAFLLDRGAAIDGTGEWTPLEESLYWGFPAMTELLLSRGAAIRSLRAASGLGRLEEMEKYFDHGALKSDQAGGIHSPFGDLEGGDDRSLSGQILDNALSYAAMGGHEAATHLLIERGADVNAHPLGFHYRGTALHWAAIRGHDRICNLLLAQGADPGSKDLTIRQTPAGWARHDGHADLATYLDSQVGGRDS
jgi:hypothetical protein